MRSDALKFAQFGTFFGTRSCESYDLLGACRPGGSVLAAMNAADVTIGIR